MESLRARPLLPWLVAAVAVAMMATGYLVVRASGFDSANECNEALARIEAQNAEARERLGSDAPILDFQFPEACLE